MSAEERKEAQLEEIRRMNLKLPSQVFASKGREEDVGLLNKAAPVGLDLSLDPDIVAALDDDYNFEDPDNEFGDDFIMQLNEEGDDIEEEGSEEEWEDADSDDLGGGRSDDEEDDEVPSLLSWTGEETRTKFTNYSMSSSVIRRNKQLSLLDDQFDR